MKKFIKVLILFTAASFLSSCLDYNLKTLDTYDGSEILGVQGVYHRYYLNTTIPVSGERQVKQNGLTVSNQNKDIQKAEYTFDVSVPSNFPSGEVANVSASNLVVVLNVSSAAIVEPQEGSPKLGVPGDWSKPNKYLIKAADESSTIWTVKLNLLK